MSKEKGVPCLRCGENVVNATDEMCRECTVSEANVQEQGLESLLRSLEALSNRTLDKELDRVTTMRLASVAREVSWRMLWRGPRDKRRSGP